jgi:hypothetical protein
MATPYCSRDQWAARFTTYANWAAFAAVENWPTEQEMQDALEDATNIMNDNQHIATNTNITDSNRTERLERICGAMATRMLGLQQQVWIRGGNFDIQNWSAADFLISFERRYLIMLAVEKEKRYVGKVG